MHDPLVQQPKLANKIKSKFEDKKEKNKKKRGDDDGAAQRRSLVKRRICSIY